VEKLKFFTEALSDGGLDAQHSFLRGEMGRSPTGSAVC